ncbi:type 1 glutamine amidotransferase domain-containing protein [Ornithinimicrobium tianjinense]|uniref:Protease n=1 Tax=Ornithinimicrobium tianjinense TaxID=1195761 RepID=A0A917BMF4_9MICO|nr:type 1 glutamine amidotransferase domain-containing protein [Ornithinimicrobium tianjinense]GGF49305.1 protease [Ornithinimicrobium tianjinense]
MAGLEGKNVAFVLTDGFEDSELTSPWQAVVDAGGTPHLISPKDGEVEGKKGHTQAIDVPVADASAEDYDALVLPGGTANADKIRMDDHAVALTRAIVDAGKPVAAICHGAWILTDADAVRGRRMTSYPSLRTDLRNAGADWVDEEVVVDEWLVSSRTPADLPAFNRELVRRFSG